MVLTMVLIGAFQQTWLRTDGDALAPGNDA